MLTILVFLSSSFNPMMAHSLRSVQHIRDQHFLTHKALYGYANIDLMVNIIGTCLVDCVVSMLLMFMLPK